MTSKSLFFKLIKQDFKKRIWCPILIFISYFLIFEVVILMQLEEISRAPHNFHYSAVEYMSNIFFGSFDVMYTLIICFTAVVCGISGFSYLNSKMQIDTYHSMPVSRTTLFFSKYVSGMLQFTIPFVVHVIICLVIAAIQKVLIPQTILNAFIFIGVSMIFFVLAYSCTLLAAVLTGNTIISVLGSIVIFAYSYLISFLAQLLFDKFFDMYVLLDIEKGFQLWAFSPAHMIMKYNYTCERMANSATIANSYLVIVIIAAVVYTVISYVLYKNRASEGAGRAIAFEWAKPIIKTLITIPVTLYSGFFFNSIAPDYEDLKWFIFGVIFGYVIVCMLIEVVFELDIRSAFNHKKQFVFNAVCVLLVIIVFKCDVFGYDSYVPKENKLDSCSVSIHGLLDVSDRIKNESGGYDYIDSTEYTLENMQLRDNESVLELAKKLASEGIQYEDMQYYEGIEKTQEYKELNEKQSGYRSIIFGYNLKSGKKVYRQYVADISDEQTAKLIAEVFNDTDYKLGSNPVFNTGWKKEYEGIKCLGHFDEQSIILDSAEINSLMEIYQSEYMQLTFDTVRNTIPLGKIGFMDEMDNYNNHYNYYIVYPEFTKTIELIKQYGFDYTKPSEADSINKIELEVYEKSNNSTADAYLINEGSFTKITDKEQIEKIMPYLVNSTITNGSYMYTNDLYYEGDFNIFLEKTNGKSNYYHLKNGYEQELLLMFSNNTKKD